MRIENRSSVTTKMISPFLGFLIRTHVNYRLVIKPKFLHPLHIQICYTNQFDREMKGSSIYSEETVEINCPTLPQLTDVSTFLPHLFFMTNQTSRRLLYRTKGSSNLKEEVSWSPRRQCAAKKLTFSIFNAEIDRADPAVLV